MKIRNNPAKFREMSVPFENAEVANDAIAAFYEDLSALREKHRLANVYTIVSVSALDADGEELGFMSSSHFGNGLESESLCAWAYGRESLRREEAIAALLKSKGRK